MTSFTSTAYGWLMLAGVFVNQTTLEKGIAIRYSR